MKRRALIVDDSEVQRYVLRAALEGDGYEVHEAAGATPALAIAATLGDTLTLACVDWDLGDDGAGSDVLRALAAAAARCTVVVVSGDVRGDMPVQALAMGAHDVLEKSGDVAALRAALRASVSRRGRG